jgi:hypothetical protein
LLGHVHHRALPEYGRQRTALAILGDGIPERIAGIAVE